MSIDKLDYVKISSGEYSELTKVIAIHATTTTAATPDTFSTIDNSIGYINGIARTNVEFSGYGDLINNSYNINFYEITPSNYVSENDIKMYSDLSFCIFSTAQKTLTTDPYFLFTSRSGNSSKKDNYDQYSSDAGASAALICGNIKADTSTANKYSIQRNDTNTKIILTTTSTDLVTVTDAYTSSTGLVTTGTTPTTYEGFIGVGGKTSYNSNYVTIRKSIEGVNQSYDKTFSTRKINARGTCNIGSIDSKTVSLPYYLPFKVNNSSIATIVNKYYTNYTSYSKYARHYSGYYNGTAPYYSSEPPTSKQKEGSDYIALLYFLKQVPWINFTDYIYYNYSNTNGIYVKYYGTTVKEIAIDTTYSNVIIYIPRYQGMNDCTDSAVSFYDINSKYNPEVSHTTEQVNQGGGSGNVIQHNTLISQFTITNKGPNKIIFLFTAMYPDRYNYRDKNYDYYGERIMPSEDRKEDRPIFILNNKRSDSTCYSSSSASITLKFIYKRHTHNTINWTDKRSYYVMPEIIA